jgi:hypothetical protein
MKEMSPSFEAISGLGVLPPTLLQRLLAPHAASLAAAGLDPSTIDAVALWNARERLPDGLVDSIHRIHDMSDDAGYDHLLSASGGPLFVSEGGVLPSIAVAARTLLDAPTLFNRAHGRRFVEVTRKFREFPGRTLQAPRELGPWMPEVERRLSEFFLRRGRSGYCRIRPWTEGGNHHFLVSHGRCCRSDDAVYEDGTEHTLVWRPQQHDLVVYDPRTGRLRVSASDAPTLYEYVEGFGQLMFGDAGWFAHGAVVSLEPLLLARTEVLRPSRGLLAVKLVELEVGSRSEGLASLVLKGDDVARWLDETALDPSDHGPLRHAKIRLRVQSDGRWRTVSIGVPDRVTGDWRREGAVVRQYLEERGFLAGPLPQVAEAK